MSLVKKLQPGGSISPSLDDALNTELSAFKFKSKDERKVRDALVKLRDYANANKDAFSIDPVAQKFTLTGLGSEKFEGSPDEIRSNWFTGNLKIKDDKDAMSVAAAIYGNALKNSQTQQSTTTIATDAKTKLNLGNIKNYVVDTHYGSLEAYHDDFNSIKSNDERKKKVLELIPQYLADYENKSVENKDLAEYVDLEKLKDIRTALGDGSIANWDAVKTAGYKFKWNLNEFLISDADLATQAEVDKVKAAEKALVDETTQLEQDKKSFIDLGISPETVDVLISRKFKPSKLRSPKGYQVDASLNKYITDKGGFVFEDPNGRQLVINRAGQPINVTGTEPEFNEFSRMNGIAWGHNDSQYFEYRPSQFKKNDFGDIGVELEGFVPGYSDWSYTGWSGSAEAPEGGRDYTKHIVLQKGNEKVYLEKGADGKYKYKDGRPFIGTPEIPQPQFTAYGDNQADKVNYLQAFPKLYDPKEWLPEGYNFQDDLAKVKRAVDRGEYSSDEGGQLKRSASRLLLALIRDPSIRKKTELKNTILEVLYKIESGMVASNKIGGILRGQKGTKFQEYVRALNAAQTPEATSTQTAKPSRNISGTFKDQSGFATSMDILSTAGAVGSFVPGYGAIGAGVMTAADLAKDLEDGHIDNVSTHLINAGFIGLSLIGLGGLKTLLKVGQTADKGLDIAKLVDKASKVALSPAERLAIKDLLKLNSTYGSKTAGELLEKVAKLGDKGVDAQKIASEGIEALKVIEGSSTSMFSSLGKGISNTVAKGVSKVGSSKPLRIGLRAATIASAAPAVYNMAPTIAKGEWEYLRPSDIKSVVMAGSAARNWRQDFMRTRAVTRQATEGVKSAAKTTFKIDGKEFELKGTFPMPKDKSSTFRFGKTKIAEGNAAEKTKYKESLLTKLKDEKQITDEEFNVLKTKELTDVNALHETKTGVYTLGDSPKAHTGDRRIDARDYNIAKKYVKPVSKPTETNESTEKPKSKEAEVKKTESKVTYKKGTGVTKSGNKGNYSSTKLRTKVSPDEKLKSLKKPADNYVGKTIGDINSKSNKLLNKIETDKPKSSKVKDSKAFEKNQNLMMDEAVKLEKKRIDYINSLKKLKKGGILKFQSPAYSLFPKTTFPKLGNSNQIKLELPKTTFPKWGGYEAKDMTLKLHDPEPLFKTDRFLLGKPFSPYLNLKASTNISTPTSAQILKTSNTVNGSTDIDNQKGVFTKFGNNLLDPTAIANLSMYASTINSNRIIGNEQRKAVAAGLYSLPTLSYNYLRIARPMSLIAGKQATAMESQGRKIAESTSDLNKGISARLEATSKAADINFKGEQVDLDRSDKLKNAQLENNAKIDQYNLGIIGKNRGMAAEAFKNIHLINANQTLAQNTAFSNLVRGLERGYNVGQYKNSMNEYLKMSQDPILKAKYDEYAKLSGDEGRLAVDKEWNDLKTKLGTAYTTPVEQSQPYITWQNKVKELGIQLEKLYEPIRAKQTALQYEQGLLYLKKGGGLTKAEKLELEAFKFNNKLRLKEMELAYKAILEDNELLQKSLIKIFK